MKLRYFLFAAVLLFCGLSMTAQEKTTYPFVERDSTLYLDVHRPTLARTDKAAVIAVFGVDSLWDVVTTDIRPAWPIRWSNEALPSSASTIVLV